MEPQPPNMQSLMQRLTKLENENRLIKGGAAVLAVIVSALFLLGQTQNRRTVEAEEFIVRDQSGKMRAKLSVVNYSGQLNTGESALELYDETGKELVGYGDKSLAFQSKDNALTVVSPGSLQILTPEGRFNVRGPNLSIADGGKFGSGSLSRCSSNLFRQGEERPGPWIDSERKLWEGICFTQYR